MPTRSITNVVISLLLSIACAQAQVYENDASLQQRWLPFLKVGVTKKDEVSSKLGDPYSQYEIGRIWIYYMDLSEAGQLQVSAPMKGIRLGDYHLVLVFDENDFLKGHSLLRFR